MGERRYIRFKASDGMELDGYLTLPAGVQSPDKLPMVLLPHGGPHVEGDRWAFDNDAQFLASRGYLVLQVNFRGSRSEAHTSELQSLMRISYAVFCLKKKIVHACVSLTPPELTSTFYDIA